MILENSIGREDPSGKGREVYVEDGLLATGLSALAREVRERSSGEYLRRLLPHRINPVGFGRFRLYIPEAAS
jgi:hypothetical protein